MTEAPRREWKSVQLPGELLRMVDEVIKQPELGYTSRSEFIKEAVRLRVEQIESRLRERGVRQIR